MAERAEGLVGAFSTGFEDCLIYSLNYMAEKMGIEFSEDMIRKAIVELRTSHEMRVRRDLARVAGAVGAVENEDVVFYMANALAAQIAFTALYEGRHHVVRSDIDIAWKDYPKLAIWGDVFRKMRDIEL
jgi:hypothetical protein